MWHLFQGKRMRAWFFLIVSLARREFWEAAVIESSLGRTEATGEKSGKRMALSCFPPAQRQTGLVAPVRPGSALMKTFLRQM